MFKLSVSSLHARVFINHFFEISFSRVNMGCDLAKKKMSCAKKFLIFFDGNLFISDGSFGSTTNTFQCITILVDNLG